jgi:prepilin peptidase CpaA
MEIARVSLSGNTGLTRIQLFELRACFLQRKIEACSDRVQGKSKMNMSPLLSFFLMSSLIASAVTDLRFAKIPNWITFPTMAAGILYHTVVGGQDGLFYSLGGLALGVCLLLFPYMVGKMGAGDVKLMGATGSIIGLKGIFLAFVITSLAAGLYAGIVLAMNRRYVRGFLRRYGIMLKTFVSTRQVVYYPPSGREKSPGIRYGVAVAVGTTLYMGLEYVGCDFTKFGI